MQYKEAELKEKMKWKLEEGKSEGEAIRRQK